jgi:hypothetical protein
MTSSRAKHRHRPDAVVHQIMFSGRLGTFLMLFSYEFLRIVGGNMPGERGRLGYCIGRQAVKHRHVPCGQMVSRLGPLMGYMDTHRISWGWLKNKYYFISSSETFSGNHVYLINLQRQQTSHALPANGEASQPGNL